MKESIMFGHFKVASGRAMITIWVFESKVGRLVFPLSHF